MSRQAGRSPLRAGDAEQRRWAARIGEVFPAWLVMWGAWTREFWAFPLFAVPRGTVVHAADPGDLASRMRAIQSAVQDQAW